MQSLVYRNEDKRELFDETRSDISHLALDNPCRKAFDSDG